MSGPTRRGGSVTDSGRFSQSWVTDENTPRGSEYEMRLPVESYSNFFQMRSDPLEADGTFTRLLEADGTDPPQPHEPLPTPVTRPAES